MVSDFYQSFDDLPKSTLVEIIRTEPITGHGLIDAETGVWTDCNSAYCELIGYTVAELSITPWWEITQHGDDEVDREMVSRVADGRIESYRMRKSYIGKFGERIPCEIFVMRVPGSERLLQFYVRAWPVDELASKGLRELSLLLAQVRDELKADAKKVFQAAEIAEGQTLALRIGKFVISNGWKIATLIGGMVAAGAGAIYTLAQ